MNQKTKSARETIAGLNDKNAVYAEATWFRPYASPKTLRRIARTANRRLAELEAEAHAKRPNVTETFKRVTVPAIPARLPEGRSRRKVCGRDAKGKIPNAYPHVKGSR